jgi:hypothetical protein
MPEDKIIRPPQPKQGETRSLLTDMVMPLAEAATARAVGAAVNHALSKPKEPPKEK